jgi:superfamily II DNA/RNA helicase
MTECKQSTLPYEDFEDMPIFKGPNANFDLLSGILKHGFEKPSTIQKRIIVPISEGYNVIAQSQSGTGKTGSFVIGSLSRLDPSINHVQIIIMAHTHELAEQTYEVMRSIGSELIDPNKVELCVGKRISVDDNIVHINKGSQVLVGTPGRIRDLVFRVMHKKETLINPKYVRTVILDEADRLLSKKFYNEIVDIVEKLENPNLRLPGDYLQLCIFSATLPDEEKDALDRARLLCVPDKDDQGDDWRSDPRAPIEILVPVPELSLEGIEQFYYQFDCPNPREVFSSKVELILALHEESVIAQCIIYVNNQDTAIRLQTELNNNELNSQCIYGRMMPKERISIINSFRRCETRILISTDLLARGFDVQQVSMVINFDLPYVTDRNTGGVDQDKMAEYLHRIGRSGRYGRKGLALNLIATPSEHSRLKAIEEHYETVIKVLPDDINVLSS